MDLRGSKTAKNLPIPLVLATFVSRIMYPDQVTQHSMIDLAGFKQLLSTPQRVVITTHHKPDADALGSSLGWASLLKKLGHVVNVIVPSDYPSFLKWMEGEADVLQFDAVSKNALAKALIADATLICCLDFSALNRINEMAAIVRASSAVKVMVDHHLEPESFADFMYWDTKAAATCELIFDLIHDLGYENLIDKGMAECLYAGIMTDTGSFRHPSTTAKVHKVIAQLIDLGADNHRVHKLIYDTSTEDRLRLLGYVLSQKMVVLPEYATAYIVLTADELKQYHSQTGDTEGFVNYALGIEGVRLAAIIVDRTEAIKISFRSTGSFSVNDFARAHFEGGGHRNAAGGKSNDTLSNTVKHFIDLLPQYQDELIKPV